MYIYVSNRVACGFIRNGCKNLIQKKSNKSTSDFNDLNLDEKFNFYVIQYGSIHIWQSYWVCHNFEINVLSVGMRLHESIFSETFVIDNGVFYLSFYNTKVRQTRFSYEYLPGYCVQTTETRSSSRNNSTKPCYQQ